MKHLLVIVLSVSAVAALPERGAGQDRAAAEVYLNQGIRAFMADDFAVARDQFGRAIGYDSSLAAAHYFRGLTLLQQAIRAELPAQRQALSEEAILAFRETSKYDPTAVLAVLEAARADLVLGRFESAEAGFRRYLEERPNDPTPYLFLAIAHYQRARQDPGHVQPTLQHLDDAEAALRRSQKEDRGTQAEIELYRGLVKRLTTPEAARPHLQQAAALAPDSVTAELARKHLTLVEGDIAARRPWDLTLQWGVDWDSNVVLRGDNTWALDTDDSDWRLGFASSFTYRFFNTDAWTIGAGLSTFDSWHTDIDEFDVQNYGANAFLRYTPHDIPELTLGLRYDWDHALLGNDTFLVRHRLTPEAHLDLTDWSRMILFYQLDIRDYGTDVLYDRLDRDGTTHAAGIIQDFRLFEMFGRHLALTPSYRFERARTNGTEFDTDNHILGLEVKVPLPNDFTVGFMGEWEWQRYDNPSLFDADRSRRRDSIRTFALSLTKKFTEHFSARLHVIGTENDSNVRDRRHQAFFSHDRVIYGLTLVYRF